MVGMGSGLRVSNPTLASAFAAALLHQGVVLLAVLVVLALAWNLLRARQLRQAAGGGGGGARLGAGAGPEPAARRLLRIAFGLLWVFDGILQGQVAMPLGLPSQVVQPAVAGSPSWVHRLVMGAAGVWSHHPVTAAAAAVWIQVGIGLFLLVAPRGSWSRLAGAASLAWGLCVWVLGEAFGQLFAPGASWMFGAPGAALLYCLAGALIVLPERLFAGPALGRRLLRALGAFFLGMAVLQAWPGRGFWEGRIHGRPGGALYKMVSQMAATPQPGFISGTVRAFGRLDAAHGFAVNLAVVVSLALIGALLVPARPRAARAGVAAAAVMCLADWVLVQDFGFFGGVGTDPNSMVPTLLVLAAGHVALTRSPAPGAATELASLPRRDLAGALRRARMRLSADPAYALRSLAALGAVAIALLGAVPLLLASTNPVADPILTVAVDGTPDALQPAVPAPPFRLTDQHGRVVTLASLHGRALVVSFLDPVCTSDCPVIAQELKQADEMLGPSARSVEMVAIVANPLYRSTAVTDAFDRSEGLDSLPNWLFLSGSRQALTRTWSEYGIEVSVAPGGAMVAHSEQAYVIDPQGGERYVLDTATGSQDSASMSSFAGVVASEVRSVLAAP